ncbi:carboxymuconolactone decarboxylase family protein [Vannielia litorea]|uniref:carboxymuconolactone decarboxylase family protein n=1 Tax=Vannielia litorea TaxID=1217970 RepID=UPI001BCD5F5A|nr:carboxymuconolactone decarboxylase family protein [Vannielia litorea]MBS8229046.1 carboxymuconolactone decarboxylase family protein [Vannielia litorea]
MTRRFDYAANAPGATRAFLAFHQSLSGNRLDPILHELINLRASQMNGCAFCADMHVKAARLAGERELRLHHVATWRESQLFDARERAALEWTEALTALDGKGVAPETYDRLLDILGEDLLTDLTFAVVAINGWNRLSVASTPVPGSSDALFGLDKAGLS